MITLSILAYSNLSLDDVMYCFFYLLPFNILLTASAKDRKKNPDSTLHHHGGHHKIERLVFTPPQTGRLFVRCNGHMISLRFQTQLRVWSSSFFGFSVIIASAMERIGVFLVCVMFLGAVSTASVKYNIWNLVLTCRIPANLVDLLSTSFQEKLRSKLVKSCLKWTL